MAFASSLHSEERFLCSICLDVFTDPITTPCGHNYCKTCITLHWDRTDESKCPLCNKTFYERPEVFVNTVLAEMADQFRKSKQLKETSNSNQVPAKPNEVSCDICDVKAVKSCLVCMTSYCETHLELHLRITTLKRHKLIDPVKNLEDSMCKKHDRPLELFCKTDCMGVCLLCTQSDHKSHQIVALKEEYEGEKAEQGKTEAEVQQMIQERQLKIQEFKHSVELNKKDTDKEIADSMQDFTALLNYIERCLAELIDAIEEKQKTTEKQAEGFIKELQQEINQLEKRISELKQLSQTEDHLQLQNFPSINIPPPTKDWTKVNVHHFSHVGTVRTAVAQLEETLSQEMEKLRDAELGRIQHFAVDVTLDPDTAHCKLKLSDDGKQVSEKTLPNWRPPWKPPQRPHTERFSTGVCVLGKQSISSGKLYYEVQVIKKTDWAIGVASESINRKGAIALTPDNGYWTIVLKNGHEYWAAAGPNGRLPVRVQLQTVGVFVHYEAGLVSFYDVESRVHLFSFTGCTFTEKLYPFFSPGLNNYGKNSAPLIILPVNHTD